MKTMLVALGVALVAPSLGFAAIVVPGFRVAVYANVTDPTDLAFDAGGNLFTGRDDSGSGGGSADPVKIHRISTDGTVVEYGNQTIFDPDSVVVDVTGTISGTAGAVLVGRAGFIKAILPDQSVVTVFSFPGLRDTGDMEFDTNGRLILANGAGDGFFVSTGSQPTQLAGPFSPNKVRGFAIDNSDRIVSGFSDGTVRVFSSNGSLIDGAFATGLNNPRVISGTSSLFGDGVFVLSGDTLVRLNSSGLSTLVGTGFTDATVGEFGPDGRLFVAEFGNDRVLVIEPVPEPTSLTGWLLFTVAIVALRIRFSHSRSAT